MAATNCGFAAYIRQGKLFVQDLITSGPEVEQQLAPLLTLATNCVLALSFCRQHLLAVSHGPRILVFDVISGKLERTFEGNGRIITALTWSPAQVDLLFSGSIDGSISVWSARSKNPGSPHAQLRLGGACRAIECSATDATMLACVVDGRVDLISRQEPHLLRVVRHITLAGDGICSVAWHPANSRHLLAGTRAGNMRLYDIADSSKQALSSKSRLDEHCSDSEDGFFGDFDGIDVTHAIFEVAEHEPSVQVQWLTSGIFACLSSCSPHCSIYAWHDETTEALELWSEDLDPTVIRIGVMWRESTMDLVQVSQNGVSRINLPQNISTEARRCTLVGDDAASEPQNIDKSRLDRPSTGDGMLPVSISQLRYQESSFARTSRQLKYRKASFERTQGGHSDTFKGHSGKTGAVSPPPPTSMASSLELPKQRDEEGSPMPFLSPSIPSRKPSPGELTALDDNIKLLPLPRASSDSIQANSTANSESDDSDDETFVDGMHGSASFLPGGINVPLPKACAALFTPTGELLTFFPPKPKLASSKGQAAKEDGAGDPKANARRVARLFPSFGNLAGEGDDLDEDSGFESMSSVSERDLPLRLRSNFSFFPSSIPSEQSWKARISPTKHSFTEQSPHKVIVALHDFSAIETLLPASRTLAQEYKILCEPEKNADEVCQHNARAAETLGLHDAADVWRLLALLFWDRVHPEKFSTDNSDLEIPMLARKALQLGWEDWRTNRPDSRPTQTDGNLCWTNNPLGSAWIIRAIFDWAESLADTQFLATLSAILAYQPKSMPSTRPLSRQNDGTHLLPHQQDYFSKISYTQQSQSFTNSSLPTLRTSSTTGEQSHYQSPVKPQQPSAISSCNPSQPSTPYFEFGTSTPSQSLPTLGRQSTRLSASGSASPEHHRTSFSAAAKYYAQSISDKFASYGAYSTSPPAKKIGTSPSNTNELSTSFQSGSWGKSVSFASTTNTTKASLLSTSYEDAQEDEGYDSDKTIEDLSQPQTPRDMNECIVTCKNDKQFDDDALGGSHAVLLPPDMVTKCRLWCEYYVEQLRCWDLLAEAAEMEKVCGVTCLRRSADEVEHAGMHPVVPPHRSKTCSICSVKMTGAQLFCSRCSHTAHLSCIESFVIAMGLGEEQVFLCPSGCGCNCDQVPFEAAEVEPAIMPRHEKPMKKASFTDPMLWRARVEGDSW